MSFFVYLLRCVDGSYYAGHTEDLEVRVAQHRSGDVPGYTRGRRPVRLVWAEEFESREEAFARERQIKGWTRVKKEALIRGSLDDLAELSRSHSPARGSTSSP